MDSQNPSYFEQALRSSARQDASPSSSISEMRFSPGLAETAMEPELAASSSGGIATEQATDEAHPELDGWADDQPITVPVLSIQPITKRWERVLDDGEIEWPDDQPAKNESEDDWPKDHGTGDDDDEDDERELEISDGIARQLFKRNDAFAFRERSWEGWKRFRKTTFLMSALVIMVLVAIVGAAAAVSYARRATQSLTTSPTPTTSTYNSGVVIQPGSETVEPTPEAPTYQIGAWVSNNAPSGGTVKVFVRVTQSVAAVANMPVVLVVQLPGGVARLGPTKTDAYGLAVFTVNFGGVRGSPVFVTATVKIDKQVYEANTVFVPI